MNAPHTRNELLIRPGCYHGHAGFNINIEAGFVNAMAGHRAFIAQQNKGPEQRELRGLRTRIATAPWHGASRCYGRHRRHLTAQTRGWDPALKVRSCFIGGEAVACDDDGLAVFERLRRKREGGARPPLRLRPAGAERQRPKA